jgi:hypothetical protein
MNERIVELMAKAGFILWADEEWKPEGETIDWSTNYDNELVKLVELVVRECNQAVLGVPIFYKDYRSQIEQPVIHDCARAVLQHFELE